MGVITTGNHPKALWPGIHDVWGRNYNENGMEHKDLFDMQTSTRNYEEEFEATGFGLAPLKSEGGSTSYDSEQQGTVNRWTHLAYSLGYICTREEYDDGLYEKVSKRRAAALAFSMRTTKEIVAANFYNRAFDANYPMGDGVALLSASHPTVNGTQSNILTVAADLSEASLEDLLIQIATAKNSRGLQIKLIPQTLHVAPANEFEAARILKSTLRSDSANNDINAIKAMGMLPGGVKVNHYFTDADAWFVRTDCPNGMIGFQRTAAEFTTDSDFDTENRKAKGYERYSFGSADFRSLFGSAGG